MPYVGYLICSCVLMLLVLLPLVASLSLGNGLHFKLLFEPASLGCIIIACIFFICFMKGNTTGNEILDAKSNAYSFMYNGTEIPIEAIDEKSFWSTYKYVIDDVSKTVYFDKK